MKKHLLTCIFAAPMLLFAQQTYTWNTYAGSWTDPANWSPQRNAPASDDILVFSANAEITNMPSAENIGKLWISNNAKLSISSASTGLMTIGHPALSAPHFLIEAGAALELTGNNAIQINIDENFSGEVSGSIDFFDGAHRLTAVSAGGLHFKNGSVFTANTGFDGNAFGTKNLNSIIFESGAYYINKAGGNPFGSSAPNAVTIFNTESVYKYQRNGPGSSMAGRSFGHFYIEGKVNFSGIGSSGNCTIKNDFRLQSGSFTFKPNTNGNHTGNFNIYGNIICEDTAFIDIGSDNMPGAVQMLGANQTIGSGGGSGAITIKNLTVNNTSTQILRNVTIRGELNLQKGIIQSSSSALVILDTTAITRSCLHDYSHLNTYTHIGCDQSYIDGPVQKIALNNADFSFPVGSGGKLRPVFLRNATGTFQAEFKMDDPYLAIGSNIGSNLHHISHIEYWNIQGAGSAAVELSFYDPNSGGITDMDALRIGHFNGSLWESVNLSGHIGTPGSNGSVTSNTLTDFGNFTLAGASDYPNNPLPLEITQWKAITNAGETLLSWQAYKPNALIGFIIERSSDQKDFVAITSVIPSNPTPGHLYTFLDAKPDPGKNRYRLKIIDREGRIYFSEQQSIYLSDNHYIKVFPNPAREKIYINIPPSSSISEWLIVNNNGLVVKRLRSNSLTNVCVDISNLSPGLYFIKEMQEQSFPVIPFIKVNF